MAVIHIATHVAMQDFALSAYTHCSPCGHRRFLCDYSYQLSTPAAAHVVIQNTHVWIPTLAHMTTWESRDNIYPYCGLCGHTPRAGHMGSSTWAVRMRRYDIVSRCHTYCGPCATSKCSWKYQCPLWPTWPPDNRENINTYCAWSVWPYSHDSGPHGPSKYI